MRQIYYNGTVYTGELPLLEAFAVQVSPLSLCRHKRAGQGGRRISRTSLSTFREILYRQRL